MMSSSPRYLIRSARAKCKTNQLTTAWPSRKLRAWYTSKVASANFKSRPRSPTAQLSMLNRLFTIGRPRSRIPWLPSMMLTSLVHLLRSIVRLARPFHPPDHLPNAPAPPLAIACLPRPSSACAGKTKTTTVPVQEGPAIKGTHQVA